MKCECEFCKNNREVDIPNDIIQSALEGNLVLFCGGGISTEAKTVLPFSFYQTICDELKLKPDYSFSELMSRYCEQPNGRRKLISKIKERFDYIKSFPEIYHWAVRFHKELSELYMIDTIVTTNWDDYFETECRATPIVSGKDLSLWDESRRNVLKIHGSINSIGSIIATKHDYKKCYKELSNNLIGSKLKTILATKTVVFIGYSFGDEDLNKILKFIQKEMEDSSPHLFIVTIDNRLAEKIAYPYKTILNTDGTFFLHQLKNKLILKEVIRPLEGEKHIEALYPTLLEVHHELSKQDLKKYPNLLYTLMYQDGIKHAFERFFEMKNTGEYYQPGRIRCLVEQYEEKKECYYKNSEYIDEVYFEGYISGLTYLLMKEEEIEEFPLYYIPSKGFCCNKEEYIELLKMKDESEYFLYVEQFLKDKDLDNTTFHHRPMG